MQSSRIILDSLFDFEDNLQNVLFLTFTFDIPFFETKVLPKLVERGKPKISVIMDYVQHTKLIQQSVRTTPIYNIDRCAGPNILHAKIFILGGAEKLA